MTAPPHSKALADQSPEAWVSECLSLVDEDGNSVRRFHVEGRDLRSGPWRAVVSVPRQTNDAAGVRARIDREVTQAGVKHARVGAYFKGSRTPVSILRWPVDPGPDDLTPEDELEPSATGIVRQALHHNEALLSKLLQVQGQTLTYLAAQNEHLEKEREGVFAERVELIKVLRDVYLEEDERNAKTERSKKIGQSLGTIVDAIAFRLTGGVVAGNTREQVLVGALKRWGLSVTDEQAEALARFLTPEQLILLQELTTEPAEVVTKGQKAIHEAKRSKDEKPPPKAVAETEPKPAGKTARRRKRPAESK